MLLLMPLLQCCREFLFELRINFIIIFHSKYFREIFPDKNDVAFTQSCSIWTYIFVYTRKHWRIRVYEIWYIFLVIGTDTCVCVSVSWNRQISSAGLCLCLRFFHAVKHRWAPTTHEMNAIHSQMKFGWMKMNWYTIADVVHLLIVVVHLPKCLLVVITIICRRFILLLFVCAETDTIDLVGPLDQLFFSFFFFAWYLLVSHRCLHHSIGNWCLVCCRQHWTHLSPTMLPILVEMHWWQATG